jgi:hypothetical protein
MSGISATQLAQLVAQKLMSVTFPRNCEVLMREPSNKTKLDSGAVCEVQATNRHKRRPHSHRPESVKTCFMKSQGVRSMRRRQFNHTGLMAAVSLMAYARAAQAISLTDLNGADASSRLKLALKKGAIAALGQLGTVDGFMGNEKVRIALPGYLNEAAKWLKMMVQGQKLDELVLGKNRAAETAMPLAKDMLVGAVKYMSVSDAKTILAGGQHLRHGLFQRENPRAIGAEIFYPGSAKPRPRSAWPNSTTRWRVRP